MHQSFGQVVYPENHDPRILWDRQPLCSHPETTTQFVGPAAAMWPQYEGRQKRCVRAEEVEERLLDGKQVDNGG